MSSNDKKLLKKYVSEILKENEFGTDAFGGLDYSPGFGTGYGGVGDISGGALYKTFIQPFVDVIGVAVGKTKELARRAITVVQVAFETVMTTLIPFLTDSYDEIFAKESQDIQKIKNEYSAYYQASENALKGQGLALALIAFPGPTLLSKFVTNAPGAAKSVLSVATGGLSDEYLGGGGGGGSKKGPSSIFDSYARSYSELLSEAGDATAKKKSKEETLADKIGRKKFVAAMIDRSPVMSAASRDAQEIYKNTLNSALEEATQVLKAKSIADIEKATGEPLEGADELKKLTGAERQKAEQELLRTVKKSIKKLYITKLETQVKPVSAAFGEDHPYVAGYREVIRKISAL